MCSLNDVDGNCEIPSLSEKAIFSRDATCRSCTERGLVVLRRKDVYCKNCFLAAETHKFRAALGKSKMMKPQDRVLVAYSGSQSSAALLHLLHAGISEDHHKKIMFSIFVLFIDEGALFNTATEEREEMALKIKEKVSLYDFPLFVCSLSESLHESLTLESCLKVNKKYDEKLVELFENVKSMSSKEDLLYLLRQKLILRAAEKLNCNKIFTAEVGTDLAVKLLSEFSLGRGDQASFETGFCDTRHPQLILRPLRDFTRKEIVFYNQFYNIKAISSPSLTTKSPINISIKKLTEKFVTDLQEEFPSTVYTVFRTAEKLGATTVSENKSGSMCSLCQDEIRTRKNKSAYSAVEAAEFSREISRKKVNCCSNSSCCGSCTGEEKLDMDAMKLEKYFCYGCAGIVRDMKHMDALPKGVIQSISQKQNLDTMKEQISDFLIDNESELKV